MKQLVNLLFLLCAVSTQAQAQGLPAPRIDATLQLIEHHSIANFGTGAFLLAASEYVRYLKGKLRVKN